MKRTQEMMEKRVFPPVPAADSEAARARHESLSRAYWGDGRMPSRICGDLPCVVCDGNWTRSRG